MELSRIVKQLVRALCDEYGQAKPIMFDKYRLAERPTDWDSNRLPDAIYGMLYSTESFKESTDSVSEVAGVPTLTQYLSKLRAQGYWVKVKVSLTGDALRISSYDPETNDAGVVNVPMRLITK